MTAAAATAMTVSAAATAKIDPNVLSLIPHSFPLGME
jgi:hypothetical protein